MSMIVSGKISVKAILENEKREINKIILLEDLVNKDVAYIKRIAKDYPIEYMKRDEMDELCENKTHGGYAIDCGNRLSDSLDDLNSKGLLSLLCVEGLRDPFNLGEILRTIHSLGFDGLISSSYNFYEHEAKLIRASAGSSEKLWWFQSDELEKDLRLLRDKNIDLIAAHRDDKSIPLQNLMIPDRSCFVLGGALRGLSRKVRDECNMSSRIEYSARTSLSTVGACTVFAYENFRQKGGKHEN